MDGIGVLWKFRIAKIVLLPNSKSDGAETWWKALGQHGDLELLKWFRSGI